MAVPASNSFVHACSTRHDRRNHEKCGRTAHLDGNPTNNRLRNLRALCQRCHMLHDRPHHLAQRWITYRRRWAVGDLFLGAYVALIRRRGPCGLLIPESCSPNLFRFQVGLFPCQSFLNIRPGHGHCPGIGLAQHVNGLVV